MTRRNVNVVYQEVGESVRKIKKEKQKPMAQEVPK
jgi:hypothetical protein